MTDTLNAAVVGARSVAGVLHQRPHNQQNFFTPLLVFFTNNFYQALSDGSPPAVFTE